MLLLEGWARDGLTDEQIAVNAGCAYSTLREWRDKFSAISAALKKGKEVTDYEVENALFNNAKGYYYTEQVVSTKREVLYKDGKRVREISEPVTVEIERWRPGDTTAQIYWTKNRMPAKWRDKRDDFTEPTADEMRNEAKKLSDKELKAIAAQIFNSKSKE